jgi:endonuclease/exonuclease/phosphatase family metal-dependent hydrolase
MFFKTLRAGICPLAVLFLIAFRAAAGEVRVMTYNVENYLDVATTSRQVKPEAAKAKVRDGILAIKPDVLAIEEMGTTNALLELQKSLKTGGLDLPFWEHVSGYDTNIHLAFLSRLPIAARRPHTNEAFLLNGRRFEVSRGFAEIEIQVNPHFSFSLISTHLKSRRAVGEADEADLRLEEAVILRRIIDAHVNVDFNTNLVVLGDFNDLPDSKPVRTIIGRGKGALIDLRPAERNGDSRSDPRMKSRSVTWTHFYAKEDTYSRIDDIFASRTMARRVIAAECFVFATPDWGLASDHRPVVVTFDDQTN